ncbi:bidirectional sugar transporter SWEET1 isoform X1 [Elaeis guineensis]|uniref:Bidirectional sugar transporter SWEET n=1 Tax=Elaeis guineensis var. tenera TaxID=51953 RepID=A0A8N4I710_ELAGV|nr:bidirectional sugar transporter SWEET1 isoform X1 [Elaeis guineensis]
MMKVAHFVFGIFECDLVVILGRECDCSFPLLVSHCHILEDYKTQINRGFFRDTLQHDPAQLLPLCLVSSPFIRYGLPFVSPNNLLVSTINGTGMVIELVYVMIFIVYAPRKQRIKTLAFFTMVVTVSAMVALVSLFALHSHARKLFCGFAAAIFSVIMYGSPLSIMRLVIRTKSVEFMPFFLSLFSFLCGTSWFIFGLLGRDPFVAVPNGCGSALGAVQLILYAIYRNRKGAAAAAAKAGAVEMNGAEETSKEGQKSVHDQV